MIGSVTRSGLKVSFTRRLATAEPARLPAAGDSGDDGQVVVLADRGLQPLTEPDVGVVQVDVDDLAQLSAAVVEAIAKTGIAGLEIVERLGDGAAVHLDLGLALGEPAQRSGHPDGDCHVRRRTSV